MKLETEVIYLDNAATTEIDSRVLANIMQVSQNIYGNASSAHSFGRKAKAILENSRKKIAEFIGAHAKEIIFTSGGTEADNLVLSSSVEQLGVKHIITTKIEHNAVLKVVQNLEKAGKIKLHYVSINNFGEPNYQEIEEMANKYTNVLISIMHTNNEIGTISDIDRIGEIAKKTNALFHSDTTQSIGHLPIDVSKTHIDFITCSAHKFHGPKGIGFLYCNQRNSIRPILIGGGQERNRRAGTENVAGISGMCTALEIAIESMDKESMEINKIKHFFQTQLHLLFNCTFNGATEPQDSIQTILNVNFPNASSMLIFKLDLEKICCSGGSACNSGANIGSHVLKELQSTVGQSIRFSFGRFTTKEQILEALKRIQFVYK